MRRIRKKTVTLSQTCQSIGATTICNGPLTKVAAKCRRGERAVGGGYDGTDEPTRQGTPQGMNRPQPATGTPRAWVATVRAFGQSQTATPPAPAKFTVYAICAT